MRREDDVGGDKVHFFHLPVPTCCRPSGIKTVCTQSLLLNTQKSGIHPKTSGHAVKVSDSSWAYTLTCTALKTTCISTSRSRLETCKRLVSVSAIDVSCPSLNTRFFLIAKLYIIPLLHYNRCPSAFI